LDYQQAHAKTLTTPAVVVYERPGGLTASDRAVIDKARTAVLEAHLTGAAAPGAISVAKDGLAAWFSVPIASTTAQTTIDNDVKAIRAVVDKGATATTAAPAPTALRVAVGGPAGSTADTVGAFAGVDGKLLAVTVLVVALLLVLTYRSPVLWLLPLISVIMAAGWSQGLRTVGRNG
jgi:RND superfamily putative drug exporter